MKSDTRRLRLAIFAGYCLLSGCMTASLAADGLLTARPADVATWQERSESFLLVDVRPPQLFDLKHARGAIQIPAFVIGDKSLPKEMKIVVYDDGAGSREALKAASALVAKGFASVYVMEGGLTAWEAGDLPIVAPPGRSEIPFVEPISSEALQSLIDRGERVRLIDVRQGDQYRAGHLPQARLAPTQESTTAALAGAALTDLIVLYDDGSGAAQEQAEQLRRKGYKAVKYLYGGTRAWNDKKLRLEQ